MALKKKKKSKPGRSGKKLQALTQWVLGTFSKVNPYFILGSLLLLGCAVLSLHRARWIPSVLFLLSSLYWAWESRLKARVPSTLDRWLSLALGVAAGYVGTGLWTAFNPDWLLGDILQANSLFLCWRFFPAATPKSNNGPDSKPFLTVQAKHPAWIWMGIFIALALLTQIFFAFQLWPAGLLGLFLLAALVFLYSQTSAGIVKEPGSIREKGWLLVILSIGALMRFPFVHSYITGLQVDEANMLLCVIDWFTHKITTPFETAWGGTPTLPYMFMAWVFKLFGPTLVVARTYTALLSLGALWIFYHWCRFYFGPRASLLATFLMTQAWWYMYSSLSPFCLMPTLLFQIAAFYLMERALREGRRGDFWWSGVMAAAGSMTYVSGRLTPSILVTWLVVYLLITGGSAFHKKTIQQLALTVLGFFWFGGAFIRFVVNINHEFFYRTKDLSLMNEIHRTGNYLLPLKSFFWTALAFFHTGVAVDDRFGIPWIPLIDRLSSVLLLAGLVLCAIHWRKRSSWLIWIGFGAGLCTNALAIQGINPVLTNINPMRLTYMIPILFLGAACGAEWLFGLAGRLPQKWKKIFPWALGSVLAAVFVWNVHCYYFSFNSNPGQWRYMGNHHVRLAEIYNSIYPERHLMVSRGCESEIIWFQCLTHVPREIFNPGTGDLKIPITNEVNRDVSLFMQPEEWKEQQEQIRKTYPNAVWTNITNPWGEVFALRVDITKEDIQSAQKGLKLGPPLPYEVPKPQDIYGLSAP